MTRVFALTGTLALGLLMAGCGDQGPPVTLQEASLKNGAPDEFLVLTQRPLELPSDYETLPEPDPSAGSRVAIDPVANARRAMGGTGAGTSPSAADAAVLAAARRVGQEPGIRAELAAETDEKLKRRGGISGFFSRLRRRPRSENAFNDQKLDAREELIKQQASGVRTPSIDLSTTQ